MSDVFLFKRLSGVLYYYNTNMTTRSKRKCDACDGGTQRVENVRYKEPDNLDGRTSNNRTSRFI